jgi:hypothetical protein
MAGARKLVVIKRSNFFRQMLNAFPMKFDHFPGTGPYTFTAICASFLEDGDFRFHQFNSILWADTDTAAAKIALTGTYVNHYMWMSHICFH